VVFSHTAAVSVPPSPGHVSRPSPQGVRLASSRLSPTRSSSPSSPKEDVVPGVPGTRSHGRRSRRRGASGAWSAVRSAISGEEVVHAAPRLRAVLRRLRDRVGVGDFRSSRLRSRSTSVIQVATVMSASSSRSCRLRASLSHSLSCRRRSGFTATRSRDEAKTRSRRSATKGRWDEPSPRISSLQGSVGSRRMDGLSWCHRTALGSS
jgi:hypothetical protein